jgi:ATP-dependent RNA helicase DDX56/DBP9
MILNDNPDIIISTPSRLLQLLQNNSVSLKNLCFLAIDEADLLLSYGHKDDLTRIVDPASGWVPRLGVQGCLMSATLGEDIEGVKGLVLRNPVSPEYSGTEAELTLGCFDIERADLLVPPHPALHPYL